MAKDKRPDGIPSDEGTTLAPGAAAREAVQPGPGAAEADVPAIWQPGDIILDLYEVKEVHRGDRRERSES